MRKAYDLLRRLRSDNRAGGRPEERLRDWTERATSIYRDGVKALKNDEWRTAQELGAAAHDLGRAVEHARNAAQFDQGDFDSALPPPPAGPGPDDARDRVARDLRRAYDRLREQDDIEYRGKDAKFYNDAGRDLYNAARRDFEAGRIERAGDLARSAEAMSHVNEHLARASGDWAEPRRPEPRKEREKEKEKERRKGEPKEKEKRKGFEAKGDRDRDRESYRERPEPKGERFVGDVPPPL